MRLLDSLLPIFLYLLFTPLPLTYATDSVEDRTRALTSVSLTPVTAPNTSTSSSPTSFPPTKEPEAPLPPRNPPIPAPHPPEPLIRIGTPPTVLHSPETHGFVLPSTQSPFLHPIAIVILLLALLGILSTLTTLPFTLMPSDPRAASSSSSAKDPRSSSSSSSKDPRAPSSSSSSSKPSSSSSSSGGGSSSSSASPPKPTQATPYISANAWMSFFLFCCLVLIILQGPLGLTGSSPSLPAFPGFGAGQGMGGLPGCTGFVAGAVPWCQPVVPAAPVVQAVQPAAPIYVEAVPPQPPQMGGQGMVAGPNGAGGYSWYANAQSQPQPQPQIQQPYYQEYRPARPVNVQYQRPGLQVQVQNGNVPIDSGMLCAYFPYLCQPLIPVAYAHTGPKLQVQQPSPPPPVLPIAPVMPAATVPPTGAVGMANLENAFYPLLVGAIALLVIFDYAS